MNSGKNIENICHFDPESSGEKSCSVGMIKKSSRLYKKTRTSRIFRSYSIHLPLVTRVVFVLLTLSSVLLQLSLQLANMLVAFFSSVLW